MALGAALDGSELFRRLDLSRVVCPSNIASDWVDLRDEGSVDAADNAGSDITNPDTQITDAGAHILKKIKAGTVLRLRLRYDDGDTLTTDPVVQVFGRHSDDGGWQRLRNKSGNIDLTLSDAATDVEDGTDKFSDVDEDANSFDLDGCDQVIVGVKTAAAGTNPELCAVEGKVI